MERGFDLAGPERDSGSPSVTASKAAREKLSTVMVEITVDAKQRFSAFKTSQKGAPSSLCLWGILEITKGAREATSIMKGVRN